MPLLPPVMSANLESSLPMRQTLWRGIEEIESSDGCCVARDRHSSATNGSRGEPVAGLGFNPGTLPSVAALG
jgi:hypothetical protein